MFGCSRLKSITLPSTGKLRDFINGTLLDILFYTSPAYCQVRELSVFCVLSCLPSSLLGEGPVTVR